MQILKALPFVLAGLSTVYLVRHAPGSLSIGGSAVPTDFITQNGKTYVPLADVAKALKMTITPAGTGFSLAAAGGAGQVNGQTGALGQTLSCGDFTLKITDVYIGDKFTQPFSKGEWNADSPSDNLVVVSFRVKNATKVSQMVIVLGGDNTALTDNDEHSYTSKDYDDIGGRGPSILPGAALDYCLIFQVPKNETPTDMVYNLSTYGSPGGSKTHQFRIALKKPGS